MQALSQSAFLQALGYAIANSLWQFALLWIIVVLANSFIKLSSGAKYNFALVAQFTGFVWFMVTMHFYYEKCSEALADLRSGLNNGLPFLVESHSTDFSSALLSGFIKTEQLLPWLAMAYLCLLIFLCVRWLKNYNRIQIIRITGLQKANVEWKLFVKKIAAQLNIKQEVKIYLSSLAKSPLTIGFLKPIILIPVASINHLTSEQFEAVILHEMAHIKRADYLLNIIQSIIEMALFFNPFTQLLSRMIKKERENSCDDWVLQFQYNASMYAEALLRIAYLQNAPAFAMHAAANKGDLLSRVKRMLNQKERNFNYRNQLFALLLMTGILSSVAWLHPASKIPASFKPSSRAQQVVAEPLAAKVDNPFFNPVFFLSKPLKAEVDKAVAKAQIEMDANVAEPATGNTKEILTKVAPVAFDKLREMDLNFNDEISKSGAEIEKGSANFNLEALKMNIDTAAINASVRTAMENELAKNDFKRMTLDIAKAKDELAKLSKDKNQVSFNSEGWKDVVTNVLANAGIQKIQWNTDEDANVLAADKQEFLKVDELKKTQEQILKVIETKKTRTESRRSHQSIQRKTEPVEETGNDSDETTYIAASPAYSDLADNYNFNFTVPVSATASVINSHSNTIAAGANIKHINIKPDEQHGVDGFRKHIIVETTDSSGITHTYHITIEVYQ